MSRDDSTRSEVTTLPEEAARGSGPTGEPVGNFRQPDGVFGTRQLQLGLRLDF